MRSDADEVAVLGLPLNYRTGEMPSQDTETGQLGSTMKASNRTTPGERVNAQTEGLTTDYVGV